MEENAVSLRSFGRALDICNGMGVTLGTGSLKCV